GTGQATGEGQNAPSGDPRTMAALAEALRDQGITRPAAEALDRGDTATAAQRLRQVADQADQLSPQSRLDLANALRRAAPEVAQSDPAMAEQMQRTADGLDAGGRAAAQGLDDLARAIEQLPQQAQSAAGQGEGRPEPGESGNGSGEGNQDAASDTPANPGGAGGVGNTPMRPEQQRPAPPERLGVEGRPLELEADQGGQEADGNPNPTTMLGGTGGTTGGTSGSGGATAPDPLRIPLEERDVVQEYFQP
ncbi:MAG TPA: hypothetical protein PKC19_15035, partial [Roseiflexaceae bacterium]|nr:hypothetical protein [Roseiflexaceae bacterium]